MAVKEFYKGKNILITGGTGYVGKAVAEKLLRTCDVGRVFLLIRAKRNRTVSQRLDHIKANVVFETLKEEKPNELEKLTAVVGNLSEANLGLSSENKQQLIDSVHVVLHSAASVTLTGDMKELIEDNLCGTRRVLKLASELKHCQVFLHISTAFVHRSGRNGEMQKEVMVPLTYPEDELMMTISRLNKNERQRVGPLLLGGIANWYTASKGYAEWAVWETKEFPRVIIRPSSISSAWKEPFPGFYDSHNSIPAILRGIYFGVIRRACLPEYIDTIPIDILVNAILASGWKAAAEKPADALLYQLASGTDIAAVNARKEVLKFMRDYPSKKTVWYPNIRFLSSFNRVYVGLFVYQFLVALILDPLLYLMGKPPMLIQTYQRFKETLGHVDTFSTKNFRFATDNLAALQNQLSDEEKLVFFMDVKKLDWTKYLKDTLSGLRRCTFKESHQDLKAARRRNAILHFLNIVVECLFHGLIWWLCSIGSGYPLVWLAWVPVLTYVLLTFVF